MSEIFTDPKILSTIDSIATKAKKLNSLADEGLANFALLDQQLRETNLGIRVEGPVLERTMVTQEQEHHLQSWINVQLGWDKVEGKWQSVVRKYRADAIPGFDDPDDVRIETSNMEEWPLAKAPRRLKILAIQHFSAHLSSIEYAIEEACSNITTS